MTQAASARGLLLEGFVIIASILLAFAIDAAWDERQEQRIRAELIETLIADFELNQKRLEKNIASAQASVDKQTRFLKVISTGADISRDEMSELAYAFVLWDVFEPVLSTYEAAVGRDGLASIHSVLFSRAVADFYESKGIYDTHHMIGAEIYYHGGMRDLRAELGSLGVLLRSEESCTGRSCIFPASMDLSMEELRSFVARPDVFATFETIRIVHINMLASLEGMDVAMSSALDELRQMHGS